MNADYFFSEDRKKALSKIVRTACRIFWGPDESLCKEMFQNGVFKEMHWLEPFVADAPLDDLTRVNRILGRFSDDVELFDYLETAYVSLFISNRKGQLAPLYHSCYEYENAPMMGPPAVMMKERLAGAGLKMDTVGSEPPDHLSVELEYLYFLLAKGWEGDGESSAEAVLFAAEVMLPWVSVFEKRVVSLQESEFYTSVASLLRAVLKIIRDNG